MREKQGIYLQIFNTKSISRNNTHRQSWNLQEMLTGETLKGWKRAEKANKLKTKVNK